MDLVSSMTVSSGTSFWYSIMFLHSYNINSRGVSLPSSVFRNFSLSGIVCTYMVALAFFEPLRPQHSIRVALEDTLLGTDDDGDNGQTQGQACL